MIKTIAIQGIAGSNHHIAAQQYFGNEINVRECLSFDALVKSVLEEESDQAVMAIENTIAGSIIPNYALIDAHQLHICGEYYLPIHHHLMALPEQDITMIKEVCSHPMALLQCKTYFNQFPHIKLIEADDTAAVAKRISEQKLSGVAAIATSKAAQLFNLEILAKEIQTIQSNATRFVILQKNTAENNTNQINKASLRFELDHKRGSLAAVLNVMSDCKLNLTKIQSLPIIQTPWKYAFFVDVTFASYEAYEKAIAVLQIMTTNLKIVGTYKNQRHV